MTSDGESLISSDGGSSDVSQKKYRTVLCWIWAGTLLAAVLSFAALLWHFGLSSVFGVVDVDTPAYEVLREGRDYEIRRYASSTAIETSGVGDNNAFMSLAGYIGVTGSPQNLRGQSIPMTAPVVTIPKAGGEEMQFILPQDVNSSAPQPTNQKVRLVNKSAAVLGVETFSGTWDTSAAKSRAEALARRLQGDGYTLKQDAPWQYFRYNPPWTIPAFRKNEVAVEIEGI